MRQGPRSRLFPSTALFRSVLPGLVLLLCAGELRGSAGDGNPVEHHSQATAGGRHLCTAQKNGEARAGASLALLAAPEEVGAAADTGAPRNRTPRPPPPRQIGRAA